MHSCVPTGNDLPNLELLPGCATLTTPGTANLTADLDSLGPFPKDRNASRCGPDTPFWDCWAGTQQTTDHFHNYLFTISLKNRRPLSSMHCTMAGSKVSKRASAPYFKADG